MLIKIGLVLSHLAAALVGMLFYRANSAKSKIALDELAKLAKQETEEAKAAILVKLNNLNKK